MVYSAPSLPNMDEGQSSYNESSQQSESTNRVVGFFQSRAHAAQQNMDTIYNKFVLSENTEKILNECAKSAQSLAWFLFMLSLFVLGFVFFGFLATIHFLVAPREQPLNWIFLLGTIATMVTLYETGAMKPIMDATMGQIDGLWDFTNLLNDTLTYNVALLLSTTAGVLLQFIFVGLVNASVPEKEECASNNTEKQNRNNYARK